MKSSARNAAIARRDSSWRRRDCCGAIRGRPTTKSATRSAATFAAAPGMSKSSRPCSTRRRCTRLGFPRERSGKTEMNEIVPAHNIGDYVPMIDGPEKVSGRAKYTADLIAPGMLAGRIFLNPHSHAQILAVDIFEAAKLPRVEAIPPAAPCDKTFGVLP